MKYLLFLMTCLVSFESCQQSQNIESLGSWGFSPNGDGINDLFILAKSDSQNKMILLFDTTYVNKMTIFENKSNNVVYKGFQYHRNWWNGRINNTGDLVSVGLYEFCLEMEDDKVLTGYVYVKY